MRVSFLHCESCLCWSTAAQGHMTIQLGSSAISRPCHVGHS
jgi:hypothetical protein